MTIEPPLSAGFITISLFMYSSLIAWYSSFFRFFLVLVEGLSSSLRNTLIIELLYVSKNGSCPLGGVHPELGFKMVLVLGSVVVFIFGSGVKVD